MSFEKELASQFVSKYPNQFTEDKWFWEKEVESLLTNYKELIKIKVEPTESNKKVSKKKEIKKSVKKRTTCPDCKSKNIFYYNDTGSCEDCYTEWWSV